MPQRCPRRAGAFCQPSDKKGTTSDSVHGFRLCVARAPSPAELARLLELYRDSLEKYEKDPAAAKAMATSGLPEPPQTMNTAELAAWTVVANVLLNLDETVTKR